MNIKEIALPLINKLVPEHSPSLRELILQFAEALVAELAKENEPVAWCVGYDSPRHGRIHSNPTMYKPEAEALVLAAVPNFELSVCDLYALPPTAEQIEQETAEAIAAMLHSNANKCYLTSDAFVLKANASLIIDGAWKEFKK